jgi:Fic family protein
MEVISTMIFKTPTTDEAEAEVLRRIDAVRETLSYALQTPKRWTALLRRNLIARAVQGSNSIEGYNASLDDAVAVVEGEQIDDVAEETRLALEGYQSALTYILLLSDDKHFNFNEELIRSLHFMMLSYSPSRHPGRWRPGPIYVRREPSGEVVYEGPDPDHVPSLMREFVEQVSSQEGSQHAIVRAAMAHLNLVMIHPFSDGNGRMGRALQTFVLAREGIMPPVFSSIEEYLGSRGNTEAYYKVLAEVGAGGWHPERDARAWIRFCLGAHLQQATTVARRVKETARLWDELEAELKRRRLDERMIYALYEAAVGLRVRSARYRTGADISNQVAARDLKALVENGLLVPKGEKRGRIYLASQTLLLIREKTREPRAQLGDVFRNQLPLES